MLHGYVREYKGAIPIEKQINMLQDIGCKVIWEEDKSSTRKNCSIFNRLIDDLQTNDTLIVDRISTLRKTVKEFVNLLTLFKVSGFNFRSITEPNFNTEKKVGKIYSQLSFYLIEMEKEVLNERIVDGQSQARIRGRKGGRKFGNYDKEKASAAAKQYEKGYPIQ